ncbi:glycosyltransferase [Leucobacter chromiisoli]|uniref:glycosyltransferase n=1 Tax=Leucobacter chromiisoli TaxID=2796471 RepID=UPI0027DBC1CD|nr:glycosyltransferase [Leucobacter chromiisoli]
MRVAIASRIFEPEPSAASFRLAALANAFSEAGHEVSVLTVRPVRSQRDDSDRNRRYRVRRFPVLRDRTGYVRGYLQYMSFDVPLFFRVLFGPKRDLVVVEPPPTTGFFVRLATALRRTPYAYYAADVWSDAAASTGAGGAVVTVVRSMERFALSGARGVLSVNAGVSERVRELAPGSRIHTVGNGIDTKVFTVDGPRHQGGAYAIYSGTASEWQGAGVFIDALERVLDEHPGAKLVFLGQGSDWPELQARAARLPAGAVEFVPTVPPATAAEWIRGAVVSLASIRPDSGYDFAFPTKVYASLACGTPVVYAGAGAVPEFLRTHQKDARVGESVGYEVDTVAKALSRAFANPPSRTERERLGVWVAERVGLDAAARNAVRALEGHPQ